jgi:outer membrane protein assembly factor BamB
MKTKFCLQVAATFVFAAAATYDVNAQDWPQYLGPNQNAQVVGFKAPASWPKQFKEAWKVEIGDGVATPALVGNRIYTYSRENPYEIIRCLDASTGKELWQEKHEALAPTGGASSYPGPRSSPAVADGRVVTYGVRGTLSCFEAASGKLLWRKEGTSGAWPTFFTSSSPMIINGLCIAQLGNDKEGSITAFDLNTGSEKWKWDAEGTAYASPVAMELGGSKLIIAQSVKSVVALDAATGELAWETPFVVQGRGTNSATPIVDGNTVIYAGSGRGATAVALSKKNGQISATELWSNQDNSVQFSSPILSHGVVLGLSAGNELFCINAKTGKTGWTAPTSIGGTDAPVGGGGRRRGPSGFGSVLAAGPVALALTQSSELIVFEPKDSAYAEIARIKVADTATHAYPIISGNRIFIKDQNTIALLTIN